MYLSHPVRRVHNDPLDDEVATLHVEPADDDARATFENRIESLDGNLEHELQFGGIVVSPVESAISDPCELDGVERIKTVDTLGC